VRMSKKSRRKGSGTEVDVQGSSAVT